jgi:hypothetical protein
MMKILLILPCVQVAAFSARSSFTGGGAMPFVAQTSNKNRKKNKNGNKLVMYDDSHDPPSSPTFDAWTVLANTEKWISATLASSQTSQGNPYSRKEVSYVCEHSEDGAMVVSSMFRRLKDCREEGERHGGEEERRSEEFGKFM